MFNSPLCHTKTLKKLKFEDVRFFFQNCFNSYRIIIIITTVGQAYVMKHLPPHLVSEYDNKEARKMISK